MTHVGWIRFQSTRSFISTVTRTHEESEKGIEMDMAVEAEAHGIVIVGGGICGLATALGLHRYHDVWLQGDKSTRDRYPVRTELRCLNRKDLIEALAKDLSAGSIRFGCRIAAVDEDSGGHGAVLTMADGTIMKAKVLIGCEGGTNSVVAKYLGLPPVRSIPRPVFRGFTSYPHGHPFGNEFLRLRIGDFFIGRLPVTDNLVHFFLTKAKPAAGEGLTGGDSRGVRDLVRRDLEDLQCPAEITEVVRGSDLESLNLVTNFWYRPPWEVDLRGFRRGAVTVAGDAMHAMGPFIGQGGSAGLEDAVVLARSLARDGGDDDNDKPPREEAAVGEALGEYVRERRLRLTLLSLESFIMGVLLVRSPSPAVKPACVAVLVLLGSKSLRNANFECGRL